MGEKFKALSSKAKAVLLLMGYDVNHSVGITATLYKWLSASVGKSIIDELIEAGFLFIFE